MMANLQPNVVIWGAGRIGRGFIGDLFSETGSQLVFVDESQALIDQLVQQGSYTVVRAISESNILRDTVQNYRAYHVSQAAEVAQAISQTELVAVAVFPKNFEAVAARLAQLIWQRKAVNSASVNILLCTNLIHAGPIFQGYLYQGLDRDQKAYFDTSVGVVESLVIRIAPNPPQEEIEKDALVVWTNGYAELPVERRAFKGEPPHQPFFRLVDNMRAEEIRKIYTYNMCHAVLSYHGYQSGAKLLVDCLADPAIKDEAEGALWEVSQALQHEYGFSPSEMDDWIKGVIEQTNNRTVGDTVVRSAADPLRKLHKDDRLIGPALLCLKNGITPTHLIKAIGAAFHYLNEDDPASVEMAKILEENGLKKSIHMICGLAEDGTQDDLARAIEKAYRQVALEMEWHKKALQAYELGFKYEKVYHGCGQCVVAAVTEVLGNFSEDVFNASTGLCGGMGLMNDATCSAFTGGVLVIGLLYPRRYENFDGDKVSKYTNFELVQQLRKKYIAEFGTLTCGRIHQKKYGRPYDLSQKEERDAFEIAGGHADFGCTDTVGKAAQFTIEVLAPLMIAKALE